MKIKLIIITIVLSILTGSFFKAVKYTKEREARLISGAVAECEAERRKLENNDLIESLQIIIKEQEEMLYRLDKQKNDALQSAKEQRERTNKFSKKIRDLENEIDSNCISIAANSLCLLNQAACEYNNGINCEC
jgi:peptidoglycan hydrolase CwlO-like protein